jgi:hypothetical protein
VLSRLNVRRDYHSVFETDIKRQFVQFLRTLVVVENDEYVHIGLFGCFASRSAPIENDLVNPLTERILYRLRKFLESTFTTSPEILISGWRTRRLRLVNVELPECSCSVFYFRLLPIQVHRLLFGNRW